MIELFSLAARLQAIVLKSVIHAFGKTKQQICVKRIRRHLDNSFFQEFTMTRVLPDTSVIIDLDYPAKQRALSNEISICAILLVESVARSILASAIGDRPAIKLHKRLQILRPRSNPFPIDSTAARSFGRVVTTSSNSSQQH